MTMKIAVLPFNAAANSRPALARQFANFAAEIARNSIEGVEIDAVNYMARMDEDGVPKFALVNPSEDLNEPEMIEQFFGQTGVDIVVDGLLRESEAGGTLTYRFFENQETTPTKVEEHSYLKGGELSIVRSLIEDLIGKAGGDLSAEAKPDEELFGTTSSEAFTKFLQGFDASQYIERSQGSVIPQFDPAEGFAALLAAVNLDEDWEAPALVMIQLSRLCTHYRIGNAPMIEENLKQLSEKFPEDGRVAFALGDLYSQIGDHAKAGDAFEKAHKADPTEPAILARLAIAQLNQGMPVNAERNLRQAIELEGDEKPSLDILADVLTQTERAHEVPSLWKDQLDKQPTNPQLNAKYAISLVQSGRKDEGIKAFENGLEKVEDPTLIKRYYAPVLANEGNVDRAMDYYEDCIDVAPNDIPLLTEYAQTLAVAKRDFEIPHVLKNILNSSPDQNTRANILAWLIELEQPKRVESVKAAAERAEKGDYDGAVRELKPLRNWLADYWKMWVVLASANNQIQNHTEAEDNSRRLLELFPGCEAGYAELNNALAGQGKDEEAFALMQLAIGNMPNSLPIAISYGFAAKRVGRVDEAKSLAQQIRAATSNAAELQDVLAELEK